MLSDQNRSILRLLATAMIMLTLSACANVGPTDWDSVHGFGNIYTGDDHI